MIADDPIITMNDIRKTGHCVKGIRSWFKLHDLDFKSFMADGIPASALLATSDELGCEVVTKVQERKAHG